MGYRSDVALVINKKWYNAIWDNGLKDLIDYVEQKDESGDCLLYYWESIKWYDDTLTNFLATDIPDDEYYFIRVGEDLEDNEIQGMWWDNPFGCQLNRSVVWDMLPGKQVKKRSDPAWLKAQNTTPNAVHCSSCGTELKNPVPNCPGMKYCPKCEP